MTTLKFQFHIKNIITYIWNYIKTCKEHRDRTSFTLRLVFNEVPSSLTLFLDRLYFAIVTIYFTRLWKLPAIKPLSSRYIRGYNFAYLYDHLARHFIKIEANGWISYIRLFTSHREFLKNSPFLLFNRSLSQLKFAEEFYNQKIRLLRLGSSRGFVGSRFDTRYPRRVNGWLPATPVGIKTGKWLKPAVARAGVMGHPVMTDSCVLVRRRHRVYHRETCARSLARARRYRQNVLIFNAIKLISSRLP